MIDLQRDGDVFVLTMAGGENRFSGAFMDALERALETVERAPAPVALVTVGQGKFYSNGLDLDWMTSQGPAGAREGLARALALLGRVLTFPTFTVAAINGHAFGAGAQLAAAHDLRLMRSERGYFCMPEIDMQVTLHPGMVALLQARLPWQTTHEVVVTGRRYGGEDARAVGIVDRALPEAELVPAAIAAARAQAGKAHPVMRRLKQGLYASVLSALASMPDDIFGS